MMIRNFIYNTVFHSLILLLWVNLAFSGNVVASNNDSYIRSETDKMKVLLNKCNSDTCEFDILSEYFWKMVPKDFEEVKYIGQWAWQVIKNTQNLRALSDGYDIKAFLMLNEGKHDSSFYYYNKALQLAKSINHKFRMAWCYSSLAGLKFTFNDMEGAISDFKFSTYYFTELHNSNQVLRTTWTIAYCYQSVSYDSAIVYYDKRLELFKKFPNDNLEIILCLEMANFYKSHSNIQKSIELINRALDITEKIHDEKELGNIYWTIGDFFFVNKKRISYVAFDYYKKALEISRQTNDTLLRAIVYNRIGNFYLKEGKDSLALSSQLNSLKLSEKLQNPRRISMAYRDLGYINKSLGNHEMAIDDFKTCLEKGFQSLVPIYIEIADLYLKLNNRHEALNYYNKALESATYYRARGDIALSYYKIGNFYDRTNLPLAEKYYLLAFKVAEETNEIAVIKSVADTLGQFYLQKNNYKLASYYQHLAKIMGDSLNKLDKYENIADLELEFEVNKIKKENEAKHLLSIEEIRRQKIYRNFFLLIAGMLCAIGIFLYINYKRKKKDNLLLITQKNEISEKNREIQAQMEELDRISKKLHETDQVKLRFFSNISHEIRTPLTLIINPLQNLIKSFKGDHKQKRQLDLIYSNTDRLKELTEQILDLQKLDDGKMKLKLENADIVVHIKGIISSFEGYCYKAKYRLFFDSEFTSLHCSFDKDKITKVVSNLLSNAFKYSQEKGEIRVGLTVTDDCLNLTVKDNGKGIPAQHIQDVFKRYYQLETSNTLPQGFGIGLAYVKELVELMKGRVKIDSETDKGTTVAITIPLAEYKILNADPCYAEVNTDKRSEINNHITDILDHEDNNENVLSILIVEDNDDLREFVGDLFKKEFRIIYAKNGKEGIKNAFYHLPDIIISDIMMPDTDGMEMCSTLKHDEQTSHIPIILLTAKDNVESHVEGYQSGADDYIVKPFDSEMLKLKVRNIVSTHESIRKQFSLENGALVNSTKYCDIDRSFLKKCIEMIHTNIDNPDLTVDDLSNELSFSRRNLYRKLQALTNYNPAELIRNIRMQHAAKLLKTTNMRVFEIAMSVGYDDTAHFSQTFKKQFGVLPSEYMNKN